MQSSTGVESEEYIRLGLDYGTGQLKLATQHIHSGVTPITASIQNVRLMGNNCEPQIKQIGVNLDLDSTDIRWGEQAVDTWLGQNTDGAGKVISAWKMALSPSFREREAVKRTIDVLVPGIRKTHENIVRAIQCWITTHLREIKSEVLEWYKHDSIANHSRRTDWDSLPWEIQIAVPASWSTDAANVMFTAALQADFRPNIREEAQCVAGAVMLELKQNDFVQENDCILFFDIGAGTSDATIVRYRYAPGDTRMRVERIGRSKGDACGSLIVNDEAWSTISTRLLINQLGGLDEVLKRLDISLEDCQRQVSEHVEYIKTKFDTKPRYWIRLSKEKENELDEITVPVERGEVKRWHDTWVDLNKSLIDRILENAPQCRTAVLTGGGSKNRYLRKMLSEYLKLRDIDVRDSSSVDTANACCRGALQHYLFEKDPPLRQGQFYITQEEAYDPHVHEDGFPEYNAFDKKQRIVKDCLVPILSIVDGKGENKWGAVAQEFDINPPNEEYEAGSIHFHVYRSVGHPHPAGHIRSRDPVTKEVLPGLESYPISYLDFTEATDCIRKRKPKKGQKQALYVLGFVDMRKVGERVELILKLMSKEFVLDYNKCGSGGRPLCDDNLVALHLPPYQVWHQESSHFIKSDNLDPLTDTTPLPGRDETEMYTLDAHVSNVHMQEAQSRVHGPGLHVNDAPLDRMQQDNLIGPVPAPEDDGAGSKRRKKTGTRTHTQLNGLTRRPARNSVPTTGL